MHFHRADREVQAAQAIIANARNVILVADSTKFRRTAPVRIGHISQVQTFVTDRGLPANLRKIAQDCGVAIVEARSEMSMRWPPLVGCAGAPSDGRRSDLRPTSAPSTLTAPSIPVATSLMATPTFIGAPPSTSAAPVMLISPLVAWMTKSYPGRSAAGPSGP